MSTDSSDNGRSVILLQLTMRRLGVSRKGDISEITTEADKEMLGLSKRILECKELDNLQKHDRIIMGYIKTVTVPALFKVGIYLVNPAYALEIDDRLKDYQGEREMLVAELVRACYPKEEGVKSRIAEAQERLRTQFDATNYPSKSKIKSLFSMSWRFFTMGAPDGVEGLSKEFIKQEAEKLSNLFEEAREQGIALIRSEFQGMVDFLVEKLTPDADGKPKRFYSSSVTRITEFLETFDARNMGSDSEIAALISQARALLSGQNADTIKESEVTKGELLAGMEKIKAQLAPLVKKGGRFVQQDEI